MDFVAEIILKFSNTVIIFPLIVIGYIWVNKKLFYDVSSMLFISMLFAANLKLIFGNIFPSTNFLFPSGHMLASTALYGFLAYNYKNIIFRITILVLLIAIAAALIFKGYHQLFEVVGGMLFAFILLLIYILFSNKNENVAICMAVFLFTLYLFIAKIILPHVWLAIFAFFGLSLSKRVFEIEKTPEFKEKFLATLIYFLLLVIVKKLFSYVDSKSIIFQLQWFIIGFSLPFCCFIKKTNFVSIK